MDHEKGIGQGVWSFSLGPAVAILVSVSAIAYGGFQILGGEVGLVGDGLLLTLVLLVVGLGVLWQRSGVFGRVLCSGPTGTEGRPYVALTFDDGPDEEGTREVLAVLLQHQVQATFFVIGRKAAAHPELLREMAQGGHQIENHSFEHSHSTPFVSVAQLGSELQKTQDLVQRATGRAPRWFRPPVGLLSPRVSGAAKKVGLLLCGYGKSAGDGLASTTEDAAFLRLRAALCKGAILVLHDAAERGKRKPIAAAVLRRLLPAIKEAGFQPVTLERLLSVE